MKQARLQTVITHEDELRCEKEQPIKNKGQIQKDNYISLCIKHIDQ